MKNENGFRVYYLTDSKNRWMNVDSLGKKDTITLKTSSGKLETRTCQYWTNFTIKANPGVLIPKAKITYRGKVLFVTKDTILED